MDICLLDDDGIGFWFFGAAAAAVMTNLS